VTDGRTTRLGSMRVKVCVQGIPLAVGLALMLVVPQAVAGQTIDVIPTMPPAPVCPRSASVPEATPGTTGPTSPHPSASPDGRTVRAIPPLYTATPERLPVWRGSWDNPGPDVAIAPRTGAAVVTVPRGPFRTILWGGTGADGRLLNDGVMIDDSGATRVLPAAPICPRRDFAWSVSIPGVVIWGGTDDAGQALGDGAWYSPYYGTWGLLPPSPLPPGPAFATGSEFVVRDPATGRGLLSRLEASGDALGWSAPMEVPLPAGERFELVCCDAAALLVFSIQPEGFAHAASMGLEYPHDGEWTQLGRVPLPAGPGGGPVSGRATERELTAWVRSTDMVYPTTDISGDYGTIMRTGRPDAPWRLTAPAPEGAVDDRSLVLSPTHLISVQGMVAYDLMAERWVRLTPRGGPERFGPPEGATAWWNDGKLWVFGGRTPDGSLESRLWTFTPRQPRDTRSLPTRHDLYGYGEGCVAFGSEGTWRLRGSLDDPLLVWTQSGGKRQATHWPEGWVARFRPKLEVVDTRGRVRYRDGDVCRLDIGTGG